MKAAKLFFILLCLAALIAPAAAAGGSGTAADPYVIQTPAELQSIQNNLAAYYVLGNDIDLQGYSWTPIGSNSAPFIGSLDGNNHYISNLVMSTNDYNTGLFGVIGNGGIIKNINIRNFKHTAKYANAALLIGNANPTQSAALASISNCNIYSSILINDAGYSGLLLGGAGGSSIISISDCGIYDSIFISVSQYVGMLQGAVASGAQETVSNIIIKNCIISGSTGVSGCIGGIYAYDPASTSSLTASNINVECCTIRGTGRAGGIIGLHNPAYSEFVLTDSTVKDTSIIGETTGGLTT